MMPQVRIGQGEDRFMRVTRGNSVNLIVRVVVCVFTFVWTAGVVHAQQPAPAPPPSADSQPAQSSQQGQQPDSSSAPATQSSSSSSSSSGKRGHSHASDFLLVGTVFTDKAYAFPGARIRVRRSSEKKYRWETYTNSRGEFALRVPQGDEYEIVVLAKGFADQNGTVNAKSGISEDKVVYRLQPVSGGKK
jgi:hypothetical protein